MGAREHYTPHAAYDVVYTTPEGQVVIYIEQAKRMGILADAEDGSHYPIPNESPIYFNPKVIELGVQTKLFYDGFIKRIDGRQYMLYKTPKELAMHYQPYSYIWIPTEEPHWLHNYPPVMHMFLDRFIEVAYRTSEEES